ncbi:hypothetical protein ACIGG9_21400 [Pseudonocardia alni]|uniref:hypothetical protein n=1 Tax=Pseudonocardia alni TaxID=33907 RepID=UPI0033FA438B
MTTPVAHTSRRRLLATAPATALTVAGLATLVATQPPDRTLPSILALVVVGLLAIGLPLLRLRSGRPDVERRAVGTAWAVAVIVWWVPGTRLAPQVPGWAWTAGVLAAVAAAYGIGHLLAGPDAPRPSATGSAPAGAVRTPLAPGERYLWARTVLSRPTLVVAAVLLLAAVAQLPAGGSAVLVVVLVAAAVVSTALGAVARVRVDGDGVHVRQALLGRPLAEAPLAEVRGARSEQLDPERFGWNEYGVLRRSPSVLGYRARRAGEALVLDLTDDRRFVVTVPDAATAAGLVNAELDRRAGNGAAGAAPSC